MSPHHIPLLKVGMLNHMKIRTESNILEINFSTFQSQYSEVEVKKGFQGNIIRCPRKSSYDVILSTRQPPAQISFFLIQYLNTSRTKSPEPLTHVKQVLLLTLFGCRCHALRHVLCLGLQRCKHLGVDLLRVYIRRHLCCFRDLSFALRQTAHIERSWGHTLRETGF